MNLDVKDDGDGGQDNNEDINPTQYGVEDGSDEDDPDLWTGDGAKGGGLLQLGWCISCLENSTKNSICLFWSNSCHQKS